MLSELSITHGTILNANLVFIMTQKECCIYIRTVYQTDTAEAIQVAGGNQQLKHIYFASVYFILVIGFGSSYTVGTV